MLQKVDRVVAKLDRGVAMASIFSYVCCKCVYLHVAYVSHICYKCFIWMLRLFAMIFKCFLSVSDICFKCLIYLQMYIVSLASRYFKSRSDVAHEIRVESMRGRQ